MTETTKQATSMAAELLRMHGLPADATEVESLELNFPFLREAIGKLYAPEFTADVEAEPCWIYSPEPFESEEGK